MHDAAHALDADGAAAQRLGALGERHVGGDLRRLRHVLAQHQFHQRLVEQIGDRQHALALRRRPQEHRPGADGEVGAPGNHCIGRSHAHQEPMADLESFFPVEPGILGDEGAAEGERLRRQRDDDVHVLRTCAGGAEPNHDTEGQSDRMGPFEHRILPIYGFVLVGRV
jgi:hypothetical protein